jgi:hypothetical protein
MRRQKVQEYTRIDAIKASVGALGCSMSHIKALNSWEISEERLLAVCEDDAMFKKSRSELDFVVEEFFANPYLSVLCLGNNPTHVIPISGRLGISADVQTTSCYIVKHEAVGPLIAAAEQSVNMLSAGARPRRAAIDRVWKSAQQKFFFAVPLDLLVEQLPGYSDIEMSYRDYGI